MPSEPLRIAISAGELSGDEHAARVVASLRALCPDVVVRGMGGRHLRAAGVDTIVDSEQSGSVMGFAELFGSLGRIARAFGQMKRLLREWRPHVLVTVDFADFNMRLIRAARRAGVRTVYFIPPQIWAWRRGRARHVERYADRAAVIFPFERPFYESQGCSRAVYVGHPFAAEHQSWRASRPEVCRIVGLDPARPILAVLPGSRWPEIERHLGPIRAGLELLHGARPEVQPVVVVAPSIPLDRLRELIAAPPWLTVTSHSSLEVMSIADGGLLKSGTSNLQAAFLDLPFSMFYVASPLSAFLVRRLVEISHYSIVNILRPGSVPELLQEAVTPAAIAREGERVLFDASWRDLARQGFAEIRAGLASADERAAFTPGMSAPDRVAVLIRELALEQQPPRT